MVKKVVLWPRPDSVSEDTTPFAVRPAKVGLYVREPISGAYREATGNEVVTGALHVAGKGSRKGALALRHPAATRQFLRMELAPLDYEVFVLVTLDNAHRLLNVHQLFRGTIDGASVHPREVVKTALSDNAAAVIFAHNHPAGEASPSQADELITARLRDALSLVDIRVLDHLIVAGDQLVSFAERGLL